MRRDPCAVAADPAVAPTPGFAPGEKDPSALGAVTSAQVARVWIEHEIDDGSTEQMRNAAKGVAAAWCRATCCREQRERCGSQTRSGRTVKGFLWRWRVVG